METNGYLLNIVPILLTIVLASMVVFFYINLECIKKSFKKIKKSNWIYLAIIFILALSLRVWLAPHTHYVYYDEFEHINIAENMAADLKLCECFAWDGQNCFNCRIMPHPPGFHYILGMVFLILGRAEKWAFGLSTILNSLSVILVFLISYLWFKKEQIGLWSALLFALTPTYMKFSGSAALGPTSLFFILLSILFLSLYVRHKTVEMAILSFFGLVYAIHIRAENIVLVLMAAIMLSLMGRANKKVKKAALFLLILTPIFLIPYAVHISQGFALKMPGWDENIGGLYGNFKAHFVPNAFFWLNQRYHPIAYTLLAAMGAFWLFKSNRKYALFLFSWFAVFFILYSSYHLGNFERSMRYCLNLYFPIIILSGAGIWWLMNLFKTNKSKIIFGVLMILLLLISIYPALPFMLKPLSYEKEKEYRFILSSKDLLPDNCTIFAFNPATIISTIHKPAFHESYLEEDFLKTQCKIFFKDRWCYEGKNKDRCEMIEKTFRLQPITGTKVFDKDVGFYLLGKEIGASD
ncbi:glycosyltransferase family 39 protein [Candidatus Woesearchaeota archaeon]|nr:glycosyltransferase family 39 protein [Candidatus Woesearchaeota archaeon]